MPRAIGRAARTMLSFAPLETREIRITYDQGTLPIATYTFIDARLLLRYFNGLATREQLRPYVAIEYADAGRGARGEGPRRDAGRVRGAAAGGHRGRGEHAPTSSRCAARTWPAGASACGPTSRPTSTTRRARSSGRRR